MKSPYEKLRDKIKAENENSKEATRKYEAAQCWSFAYLSRWVVLERGLKELYNLYNKERIRTGALAWLDYLNGKTSKTPDKIKDFSVDTRQIPSYKIIEELLGTSNSIKTAIDSKGKFRRKRNNVAHKAENFRTENTYSEFKKTIDKAIIQLLTNLSKKINATNKSNHNFR